MRRALALFALSLCAVSARADAQQALAQNGDAPGRCDGGARVRPARVRGRAGGIDRRSCTAAAGRRVSRIAVADASRAHVDSAPATRRAPRCTARCCCATAPSRIRSRSCDRIVASSIRVSTRRSRSRAAIPIALRRRAGMPDTLHVLVTIGLHEDGSPFVASHVRCPAVAFPGQSETRATPAWAAGHPRTVVDSRRRDARRVAWTPQRRRWTIRAMSATWRRRCVPSRRCASCRRSSMA